MSPFLCYLLHMTRPRKIFVDSRVSRHAFTLVELLVVIAIIGMLSTVAVVATSSAGVSARNAKRKADLLQAAKALELYFSDNGAYPSTGGTASWRGNCTTYGSYPDSGAGAWIPNLSPTYMATLPHDPNTNKGMSQYATCASNPTYACYLYTSNGTDYKLLAHCSPEGALSATDPFADTSRWQYSWAVFTPGAKNW